MTKNVVFCSGYDVPTLSKSRKHVLSVQGAWHSPSTVPTMVHGQVFPIIT
jgi:hypothetical protein